MALNCGIVGLPNVGKSTIFNAITRAGAAVANYPFCTIAPNVGIVDVPDERLVELTKLMRPSKVTPTAVQFLDIAGLVKGASQGEGLGNQFLGHIRQVDAIVHVVRCFTDDDITLAAGSSLDPKESVEIINTELILADLQTLEKRILKQQKVAKSGDDKARQFLAICDKIQTALSNGIPAVQIDLSDDEKAVLNELELLTAKPVLYAINCSDHPDDEEIKHIKIVEDIAAVQKAEVVKINGKLEAELNELNDEERIEFLNELGIKESGLNNLIRASYKLLKLITFFTGATNRELRAWTIRQGTRLPKAAGVIHTDLEKGFIRGEVIHYEDFVKCGSEVAIKEKGLLHVEGKEYVVEDGDILNIRFNV